jgi:hypothetical protein
MARKSSKIEIKEIGNYEASMQSLAKSTQMVIAQDMAELIKSFLSQGKLEIKDGQVMPRKLL